MRVDLTYAISQYHGKSRIRTCAENTNDWIEEHNAGQIGPRPT